MGIALAAGCSGGEADEAGTTAPSPPPTTTVDPGPTTSETEPEPEPEAGPETTAGFTDLPAGAASVCRSLRVLLPVCPTRVPESRYGVAGPPIGGGDRWADGGYARCLERSRGRCTAAVFHLEGGIPTDDPRRDRPPEFVHLAAYAAEGGFGREFPFRLPCTGPNVRDRADRMLQAPRETAACLGRTTIAGRRGTLALAPPFPAGGEAGGHLLFLWRRSHVSIGKVDLVYMVTLHGWKPVEETVRVLGEVLASAP